MEPRAKARIYLQGSEIPRIRSYKDLTVGCTGEVMKMREAISLPQQGRGGKRPGEGPRKRNPDDPSDDATRKSAARARSSQERRRGGLIVAA